jgi:tRNA(Ile)-lysidine synthetase-like protein
MTFSRKKLSNDLIETTSGYDNILVMVSGGVDSMFLLNATLSAGIVPTVVHFQHHIREEDHHEVELITRLCKDSNLELIVGHGEGLRDIPNQESVARNQRWGFVESVIEKLEGPSIVLTGHHFNDQLETFFLSVTRGRSLLALAMKKLTQWPTYTKYKPLLDIEKKMIYQQSRRRRLEWIEDVTNTQNDHERNIFRNVILPHMYAIRNISKSMRPLITDLANIPSAREDF